MRLYCYPAETALVKAMTELAQLAGIELQMLPPYPDESLSAPTPPPPPGDATAPVFVSVAAQNELAAPSDAALCPVQLAATALPQSTLEHQKLSQQMPLLLPTDEEMILSIMTEAVAHSGRFNERSLVIGVRGLGYAAPTLPVAALLAATIHNHLPNLPADWRTSTSAFPGDRPRVALVDLSGRLDDLQLYLQPPPPQKLAWAQLNHAGSLMTGRLAQLEGDWEGVSLLTGSGDLHGGDAGHIEAVISSLRRSFDCVILDLGSGAPPTTLDSQTNVWVAYCDRADILAATALGKRHGTGNAVAHRLRDHLVLWPEGHLPVRQVAKMLRQACPEIPLSAWTTLPPRYLQAIGATGLHLLSRGKFFFQLQEFCTHLLQTAADERINTLAAPSGARNNPLLDWPLLEREEI